MNNIKSTAAQEKGRDECSFENRKASKNTMANKNKPNQSDYVQAHIYRGFYGNEELATSTIIKEYEKVETIFVESNYISCITVQISQLRRLESLYGSIVYNLKLSEVTALLQEMKKKEFRGQDIFVVDLIDSDTFIIFLSSPRNNDTQLLEHLENIVERMRYSIEAPLFDMFYPYTKEYLKPAIGYSLIINNPMINNMRLIMQLVDSSKKMGEFMRMKNEYTSKYELQKIIIEKNIRTVYQPIVAMKSLDITGYEALSRGPAGTEFASPLLLFSIANEFGLSFELDVLCREKAFANARSMETDKKIFVNTLAMTIHDPEFRGQYLKKLLEDIKVKPHNVVFEINEKMAIDNYDLFKMAMKDYSDIGIVHANDDTGTGYSGLERVMELNPGFMKIDISLVRDIDQSYIKQQIIKAMVSLSDGLDSNIIAEGIETRAEYETLLSLNVKYGQGYFFGKPQENLQKTITI